MLPIILMASVIGAVVGILAMKFSSGLREMSSWRAWTRKAFHDKCRENG
jgi:hypothetical protein